MLQCLRNWKNEFLDLTLNLHLHQNCTGSSEVQAPSLHRVWWRSVYVSAHFYESAPKFNLILPLP